LWKAGCRNCGNDGKRPSLRRTQRSRKVGIQLDFIKFSTLDVILNRIKSYFLVVAGITGKEYQAKSIFLQYLDFLSGKIPKFLSIVRTIWKKFFVREN